MSTRWPIRMNRAIGDPWSVDFLTSDRSPEELGSPTDPSPRLGSSGPIPKTTTPSDYEVYSGKSAGGPELCRLSQLTLALAP